MERRFSAFFRAVDGTQQWHMNNHKYLYYPAWQMMRHIVSTVQILPELLSEARVEVCSPHVKILQCPCQNGSYPPVI